jgi:hypothetical protein
MEMRKTVAVLVAGATFAAGGVTVAAVALPGLAGAQPEGATEAPSDPGPGAGRLGRPLPGRLLDGVLDDLVADGTLTDAQADAVRDGVSAKAGEVRDRRVERRAARADALATYLGISAEQLSDELAGGKSLTEVAEAHGRTRAELVAAIVAAVVERVDVAVAEGKLTAERGEEIKAAAPERIERLVDRPGGRANLPRPGS